jgi:hypothetical protein
MTAELDLLQGTLDTLILKTLSWGSAAVRFTSKLGSRSSQDRSDE